LWEKIEPLLPAPAFHPLGCHNPRVPDRNAMEAILLVLRRGIAVERVGRERDLFVEFGAQAVSVVG